MSAPLDEKLTQIKFIVRDLRGDGISFRQTGKHYSLMARIIHYLTRKSYFMKLILGLNKMLLNLVNEPHQRHETLSRIEGE